MSTDPSDRAARSDTADLELIVKIRAELAAAADPAKAPAMKKYMKSAMPYLGVPVPAVRAIVRHEVRRHKFSSADGLAAQKPGNIARSRSRSASSAVTSSGVCPGSSRP